MNDYDRNQQPSAVNEFANHESKFDKRENNIYSTIEFVVGMQSLCRIVRGGILFEKHGALAMKRWQLFFSGRVQGVGFRYSVFEIAQNFCVTGWVRNLGDGRVEVVCEGETRVLRGFLKSILGMRVGCIDDHHLIEDDTVEGLEDFKICS